MEVVHGKFSKKFNIVMNGNFLVYEFCALTSLCCALTLMHLQNAFVLFFCRGLSV